MSAKFEINKPVDSFDGSEGESESSDVSECAGSGGKTSKIVQQSVNDDKGDGDNHNSAPVYRDFSRDNVMLVPSDEMRDSAQTFPMKLHSILSNKEFADVISWLPHGRAWRILQHKVFEEDVIPLYFRHGRYSSFARQVNGWGFKRIAHGPDYNSYYHEMFLRGMPRLCEKMKRLSGKDAKKNEENADAPVPDFYALSRQNPLPETESNHASAGHEFGTIHASSSYAPPLAIRSGNEGPAFLDGGVGDISSVLRMLQADGGSTTTKSSGGDALGSLILQALELRRNEIMQRLSHLVTEGYMPSLTAQQVSTNPLSSMVSLLQTQRNTCAPATPSGNVANLVASLIQNGSIPAFSTDQVTPSASISYQGPQNVAHQTAAGQTASPLNILALLSQHQGQQHSQPSAQVPASSTISEIQQRTSNNPIAVALLQQLQGNMLGNTSSSPAPSVNASQMLFGNTASLSERLSGGQSRGPQLQTNVQTSSAERKENDNKLPLLSSDNGFQGGPGIDINSLLTVNPNVLANLALVLQNQHLIRNNVAEVPVVYTHIQHQHNESQSSSPHLSAANAPVPSSHSPLRSQQSSNANDNNGLPMVIASLLGQIQQNGGQPSPNPLAVLEQLTQQSRASQQGNVFQDQNMTRQTQQQQQQQSANMNIQISQLQALLGQQGGTLQNQAFDNRLHVQRQQLPDQSSQVLQGNENQLMAGNVNIAQLVALLSQSGSSGGCVNK